jgi:uncharacterized DUF497 family protein
VRLLGCEAVLPDDSHLDFQAEYPYIVHMDYLHFTWDERKSTANARKHGVTFEEAKSSFSDEYAQEYYDPDHSADGDRFLLLGLSAQLRVLVVCHCFRESETLIRIVSARKADRQEQQDYWSRRK